MIAEQPVIEFLVFESSGDGESWDEWTGSLLNVSGTRGGLRSGATSTVEVGQLTFTLRNAGDPIEDERLGPNLRVRVRHRVTGDAVFTGRILDIFTAYHVDKATGQTNTVVTVVAVDAVSAHAAVTRYGAVTPGGAGFETWSPRITRLAESAVTDVDVPPDDSPIVRYAL